MSERTRNPGGRRGRGVVERVEIRGTLLLETPTHFGGETEGLSDMPLLRDACDGQTPLLTGTSIAGALRNYLHEYLEGYGQPTTATEAAAHLFGAVDESAKASVQSWLLVDDALGSGPGIELRDGVALDARTRTAEKNKKFDVELLQAGSRFPLSFELLLTDDDRGQLPLLALALRGLERGEIGLGSRKRRGLGQGRVREWRVRRYKLTTPCGLAAWLGRDDSGEKSGAHIGELLGADLGAFEDQREVFILEGDFELASSLLIRSSSGAADDPNMVHLRSNREGGEVPILSGTSLAGAVRARALRIANTVLPHGGAGLINEMFGKRIEGSKDQPSGSRLVTRETEVKGTLNLVHGRVKIDRFTGGAYPQALFFQQPVFGGNDSRIQISLELRQPRAAEIGLLLLVLKDLWTGELPLGGESSVGRGRLQGQRVTLTYRQSKSTKTWELTQRADGGIDFGGEGTPDELESYVQALRCYKEDKS